MTRNEAVYAAIREWNSAVTHYWEKWRQRVLVHRLGQVACSDLMSMHRPEGLPCPKCGAAL